MRCPSCGAIIKKRTMKCPECGAFRNKSWVAAEQPETRQEGIVSEEASPKAKKNGKGKPIPSLIEFPGVTKTSIPQWRKELGERVREVQRRAREATLESGEAELGLVEEETKITRALELLPQADVQSMNPLVLAALRRIERANTSSPTSANAAVARVAAYEERPEFAVDASPSRATASELIIEQTKDTTAQPEKMHNLAVVPPPVENKVEAPKTRKPKRLIGGDHDPALNYLDSVPTTSTVQVRKYRSAPIFFRVLSGVTDLVVVCLLSSPAAALVEFTELNWQDLRVILFSTSAFVLMGFLYMTISTALTGRTLGLKLFSLRVVDARTGLIPTGAQSAGRALIYMLSLASAGIALLYTFVDSEKHTAHDRFSRTAVVRV